MMPGMITLWSGAIVDIPAGWHLCDGTEGTPDLRNLFTVGAGDTYAVGATGGVAVHAHSVPGGVQIAAGSDYHYQVDTKSNLPPYYALAYIMKL